MSEWPSPGNTFGVESLLKPGATIYYSHDFRSRSLGRVSDLLSACLKGRELHPLQLRAVLLHGLFAAYAAHGELNDEIPDVPPVSVEVGFDDEFTFLSIRFTAKEGIALGIDDSIHSAKPVAVPSRFQEVVVSLREFCPALWVKRNLSNHFVELMVGFPTKNSGLAPVFGIIDVSTDALATVDGNYIELGDAGFLQQLTQYVSNHQAESETIKKILGQAGEKDDSRVVKGTDESGVDSSELVKGTDESGIDASQLVKGTDESGVDPSQLVKGADDSDTDSSQFFKVNTAGQTGNAALILKSSESDRADGDAVTIQGSREFLQLREQAMELESRVAKANEESKKKDEEIARLRQALESRVATSEIPVTPEEGDDGWFGDRLLKSIWPFKKSDEEDKKVVRSRQESSEVDVSSAVVGSKTDSVDPIETIEVSEDIPEIEVLENSELLKVDSKFNQVIQEMEREVRNEKAQAWNAALKAELMAEKARLSDLHREISRQLKIKENGFRNREQGLVTELKKKEDQLRQKELIIQQKNNQIASANLNLDKVKSGGSAADDNGIKLKLSTTQKLAQMKEEENRVLVTKVKDLENKLMVAQSKSSKTVDPQLMAKVQSAEKRVEEFKRMNQRLTESLQKAQEKRGEQDQAESKRKLENIERQWTDARKNLEKSEKKLKEVIESEGKLKVEFGKIQEENRKMKQTLARLQPEDPDNKNAA